MKIPSSRWSHISGLSMDSDHRHMWLWKKASLSLRASMLILPHLALYAWASQVALVVENPPANAGHIMRWGLDPWVRKTPWRRKWQPTPVFSVESPMDRGAWRAIVLRVTKSGTQGKRRSTHAPCVRHWGGGGTSVLSSCSAVVTQPYKSETAFLLTETKGILCD